MDNKKIPHGIEALRELLILFDEFGYQPKAPPEIGAEEHAKQFKVMLVGYVCECIVVELMEFAYAVEEKFRDNSTMAIPGEIMSIPFSEWREFFDYYLGISEWRSKLSHETEK